MATAKQKKNLMPIQKLNASLTPEQRKANASKAGKKSVAVKHEKKLISQMLAEWVGADHEIKSKDGTTRKMSTHEMFETAINRGLLSGGSTAVSTMKFVHEATEGIKLKVENVQSDDPAIRELMAKHGI